MSTQKKNLVLIYIIVISWQVFLASTTINMIFIRHDGPIGGCND